MKEGKGSEAQNPPRGLVYTRPVNAITVRQMQFEFPDGIDPLLIEGEPEQSYAVLGLSLLLPYLEPYLIRTMKEARKLVTDPRLEEDLRKFNAQEGQHYRQLRRFNEEVHRSGFPQLEEFERELEADYQRFTREKSLRWNLAFAEGFEALTTASARFSFERGLAGMHPAMQDLMTWHLVEEYEHRTVAFDVYEHVCGGYFYRLAVGLYAQWHTVHFTLRVADYMLKADPETFERCGGRKGWLRRQRRQLADMSRGLLPKVLWTYMPWYTPHHITMPEGVRVLAERYTERALTTR